MLQVENSENQPRQEEDDTETTESSEQSEEVLHPLHNHWTLWYDHELQSGKRPANWGSNLQEIYTFSTVEDFWRMYNNLPSASSLQQGCGFNLFKKGIEPKWEDKKNAKGGKWTIVLNKGEDLDKLWLWLMLALIGEVLEPEGSPGEDFICGCVVNIRKGVRKLVIWTTDADAEASNLTIGNRLKKTLELTDGTVGFTGHFTKSKANKWTV